jgi:hypothetical protein
MKVFQNISSVPVIPSARKKHQYYALVFLSLRDSFKDFSTNPANIRLTL